MTYIQKLTDKLSEFPSLLKIVQSQLVEWVGHGKYLNASFNDKDDSFLVRCEEVARLVLMISEGNLGVLCADYRWLCHELNAEQLYFARHGEYQHNKFEEVFARVYGNDTYMSRYINGLLLSHIFWNNHSMVIDTFRTDFLAGNRLGSSYLEVGPGHGLFLYFAARDGGFGALTGWEVSHAGVESTLRAMEKLQVKQTVILVKQDVLQAPVEQENFDVAVISEVLEHLERPWDALHTLHRSLRTQGRIFINVPINSPAPDHIYLWRSPDEVRSLIEQCGFRIVLERLFPATGCTLERSLTNRLSVSCVFIGEKL
ncbi:MAG: class I SAM-dependent methyltransferase [Magnetococcus sp. MYC-9]